MYVKVREFTLIISIRGARDSAPKDDGHNPHGEGHAHANGHAHNANDGHGDCCKDGHGYSHSGDGHTPHGIRSLSVA